VVFSAGVYSGSLRSCIVAYKYRHERWRAAPLARLLASYLSQHATWFEEFDLIVPMPAYLGPGARRRWDPTGLLVQRLSEMLEAGWDVDLRAVSKQAETPALTGRSFTERLALAEGPLRRVLAVADPVRVRRATVLVVDDVFTEGCTLREVARVLLRAGAAEVAGLVLARPPWLG